MRWFGLKSFSLIVFLLLLASPSWAAISFVQITANNSCCNNGFSMTLSGTTSGNGLIIALEAGGTSGISDFSGQSLAISGETINCESAYHQTSPFEAVMQICYVKQLASGGTKSFSSSSFTNGFGVNSWMMEVSGQDTTSFSDSATCSAQGSSGNATCSLTTNTSTDFGVAFVLSDNNNPTADTGWTLISSGLSTGYRGQYNANLGGTGSKTILMNLSGSNWIIVAAGFKPSGGGGGGTTLRHRVITP